MGRARMPFIKQAGQRLALIVLCLGRGLEQVSWISRGRSPRVASAARPRTVARSASVFPRRAASAGCSAEPRLQWNEVAAELFLMSERMSRRHRISALRRA
jgi:hypothetical protein